MHNEPVGAISESLPVGNRPELCELCLLQSIMWLMSKLYTPIPCVSVEIPWDVPLSIIPNGMKFHTTGMIG